MQYKLLQVTTILLSPDMKTVAFSATSVCFRHNEPRLNVLDKSNHYVTAVETTKSHEET